jgi:hypothetical protein
MEPCKVLAFLLCERATTDPDGKVTSHGLFDRIIIPRTALNPKVFSFSIRLLLNNRA